MWLEICKDFFFFNYRKLTCIPYVDTRTILLLIFCAFMDLACITPLPVLASAERKFAPSSTLPRSHDFTSFKGKAQESGKMEFLWQHAQELSTDFGRLEGPDISHASEHRSKVISSTEHFNSCNLMQKY